MSASRPQVLTGTNEIALEDVRVDALGGDVARFAAPKPNEEASRLSEGFSEFDLRQLP